jgi:hypothetical protein
MGGDSPALENLLLKSSGCKTDRKCVHTGVEVLIILIAAPLHKRLNHPGVPLLVNEGVHRPDSVIFADKRISPAKEVHFHPASPITVEAVPHLAQLELGRQLLRILLKLTDSPFVEEILLGDARLVQLRNPSVDAD